jgi:hypothetical protein
MIALDIGRRKIGSLYLHALFPMPGELVDDKINDAPHHE